MGLASAWRLCLLHHCRHRLHLSSHQPASKSQWSLLSPSAPGRRIYLRSCTVPADGEGKLRRERGSCICIASYVSGMSVLCSCNPAPYTSQDTRVSHLDRTYYNGSRDNICDQNSSPVVDIITGNFPAAGVRNLDTDSSASVRPEYAQSRLEVGGRAPFLVLRRRSRCSAAIDVINPPKWRQFQGSIRRSAPQPSRTTHDRVRAVLPRSPYSFPPPSNTFLDHLSAEWVQFVQLWSSTTAWLCTHQMRGHVRIYHMKTGHGWRQHAPNEVFGDMKIPPRRTTGSCRARSPLDPVLSFIDCVRVVAMYITI
jgi:hypothetical protein